MQTQAKNTQLIRNKVHQTLDFCALEVCVFDFCALPNDRPPSKFAGQTLDFCAVLEGKTIDILQNFLDIKIFQCKNKFFPVYFDKINIIIYKANNLDKNTIGPHDLKILI